MSVNDPIGLTAADRPQSGPPVSILARFAAAFGGALLLGSLAVATKAGGQEAGAYRFNLYAADRGAGVDAMRAMVQIGNIHSLPICYALGAIGIQELNDKNPTKDFMGGCVDGEMLTLRQIADRALALLPNDQPEEKN